MEPQQAKFEGWAVVELMGHQREVGFVTTEAYGTAVLFRVDVPEAAEREYTLERPEYIGARFCPVGTKVKREARPARSRLISPAAVYAINPCTEEAALKVIENGPRPLIIVDIPKSGELGSGEPLPCVTCGLAGEHHSECPDAPDDYESDGELEDDQVAG